MKQVTPGGIYQKTSLPNKLVNYYYNKWTDNRLPEKVNTVLRQQLRQKKD